MDVQTFYQWAQISVLALGAGVALLYAMHKRDTRALSAIVSIVLASLAVYRFTQLQ